MSNVVRILKQIAASEEYKALDAAIKDSNAEVIVGSYNKLTEMLEKSEAEVIAKIQELPRQSKDKDIQNFRSTFAARSRSVLPQWHWLNAQLKQQKIMEGKVFGVGSKGDPLVRTPEGRLVIITGATLKEGETFRFRVINSTEKADFGVVFELTPDNLYSVLTQDKREKIINSLASLRDRIESFSANGDVGKLPELSQLLKELQDVKELTSKLRDEEKERLSGRILALRKGLLGRSIGKLVFDFLAKREEQEISGCCGGDPEQIARALAAPGLFRYEAHLALKSELLAGDKLKGYSETADKLEKNLDSMEAALRLLDFKTKVEESHSLARTYLERMDRLFGKISRRASEVALQLETDASDSDKIQAALEKAFSIEVLRTDVREVFRGSEEFFRLRGALIELMTSLGNPRGGAEALLEPYLHRIIPALSKAGARSATSRKE